MTQQRTVTHTENPLVEFIVSSLGFVCLIALAIQTWFFVDWLMGPVDWWMKWLTLCFFDIFGGIWLILGLFHTPPTHATYQMQKTSVVICFLLSASTTVAWCFIFITRTPLSLVAIAGMVDIARWLVVVAVLYNAFAMIFYSVATKEYHQRKRNPSRRRWATELPELIITEDLPPVVAQLAQTSSIKKKRNVQVANMTPGE